MNHYEFPNQNILNKKIKLKKGLKMSNENKFEHIKIEKKEEGNYAVISINRPEKLNALQIQTLKEITEALESVEVDQSVRCVVLRGIKEYLKK